MTAQERADIERCLRRLSLSPRAMDRVFASLEEATRIYRGRRKQQARSPRIAMVVEQLEELKSAAERAGSENRRAVHKRYRAGGNSRAGRHGGHGRAERDALAIDGG